MVASKGEKMAEYLEIQKAVHWVEKMVEKMVEMMACWKVY